MLDFPTGAPRRRPVPDFKSNVPTRTYESQWGKQFAISPEIVTPAYIDELLSRIAPDFRGNLIVADEEEEHGFLHSALVVRDALCAIGQLYDVYDEAAPFETWAKWLSAYPRYFDKIGGRGGALASWEAGSRYYTETDFTVGFGTLWSAKPARTKPPKPIDPTEAAWVRQLHEEDAREWPPGLPRPAGEPDETESKLLTNESTIEGLAEALKDNPRGMMICADELTGLIGSFDAYRGNGAKKDRAAWLEAWNGGRRVH